MFKFFLSRNKSLIKPGRFSLPDTNAATIVPVLSSYLTNCCPKFGKYLTNSIIKLFYGNRFFLRYSYKQQTRIIKNQNSTYPILVISDLNIGDAINIQVACQTIKQLFPEKEIHYALSKKADTLIAPNPWIDVTIGVFSGNAIPLAKDVHRLKELVKKTNYSLLFNFCPYFDSLTFNGLHKLVLNHYPLTMGIAYNEFRTNKINHLRKNIYEYLIKLFPEEAKKNNVSFKDVSLFIDNEAMNTARLFLEKNDLVGKNGLVLFNPDASSPYTRLPLNMQVEMIQGLLGSGVDHLLISSGFVFKNVENEILNHLDKKDIGKCTVVPKSFSLSEYVALVDCCDVYVTNDTGPMHMAASRKRDMQGNLLRNKTAIYSIFGATPARIYAYDSTNSRYLSAPQDAPSRVFVSSSICRNITCINKLSKRCSSVRCFNGLSTQEMASEIVNYLKDNVWN